MKRAALLSPLLLTFACGLDLPEPPLLPAPPGEPVLVEADADTALNVSAVAARCIERCGEARACFASFDGVACGDCLPGFTLQGEVCGFDEVAVAEHMNVAAEDRIDAWAERGMVRVNDAPFQKQIGAFSIKSVWINDRTTFLPTGEVTTVGDVYTRAHFSSEAPIAMPLPVGTLLIHQTVSGAPFNGVMVKRGAGFDEDGHDWWYGKFSYSGQPVPLAGWGGTLVCTDCHMLDSGEHEHDLGHIDLLFGVPRDTVFIDD